ncbi:MAG TPA: family 78 glycoside hydrolase catalytic domain [Tepidisphaeraceae bacterium]|jgi:alpha-L-rhamnosidase
MQCFCFLHSWFTLTNRFGLGRLVITCLLLLHGVALASLKATDLRCEGRVEPLGIDVPMPVLSWALESDRRGDDQSAYQILVASSPEPLSQNRGDLWDSGKIASSESIGVEYRGKPLRAGQRAYWRVRVWDREGKESSDSAATWWELGLPADQWRATWIARPRAKPLNEAEMFNDDPNPLLRKSFSLEKEVRRARVYVSGLGYYELRINGQRVGDRVLDPGWTNYGQRVLYSTYDVTKQLQRGDNAIGIMLGNGWYNPLPLRLWGHLNLREHLVVGEPRAIVQLHVEFSDGTSQTIASDQSWKCGDGPIVRNSVYLGETYDARREVPGWDRVGFDDSGWTTAAVAQGAIGKLCAQDAPPVRVQQVLKAVKLTQPKPGVWIFDMGENFAGWARLRVSAPAGTRMRMRYGELLYPDGTLNGMTSACGQIKGGGPSYVYPGTGAPKTAWQQDEYITRGQSEEVYTPRFTFHGFRYVEVSGYPGEPSLGAVEGLRLHSDVTPAGSFSCSNELFNRIQQMVQRTQLSNMFSVQSDCPHREKFGYGGDIVASSEMAIFNFDMRRFYRKAVQDLEDSVRPNGGFTETAPFVGISDEGLGDKAGPVEWGTAHPLLLWQLYQYYGDRRLIAEQYELTQKWVKLLESRAKGHILDNGLSDHEGLEPKPRALTGTAFYYENVRLLSRLAQALGKTQDAERAEALAEEIKRAFNQKFLQEGTGRYDAGTQVCQAFALHMGLAPEEEQDRVVGMLVENIMGAHKGHLSTGIFGTKYLLDALTAAGRADVAFTVASQRTFPGWGFMLDNDATTLWEHWALDTNTFSHNHPMFGSVSEWFYKAVAGISPADDAVAFNKIIVRPQVVGDLEWVKAQYNSARGKIVSQWKRTDNQFQLRVRIPVGATAEVHMPAANAAAITEDNQPISQNKGITVVRTTGERLVLQVLSGDYTFVAQVRE